jgi:general secretion pathway protein N
MLLKPVWWLAVLLLSVLVWVVWLAPARPLVAPVDGIMIGQAPLRVMQVNGRVWDGSARWQWQSLAGSLRWQFDWRGLVPGVDFSLSGDIVASGWLGGGVSGIDLRNVDAAAPLAPFVAGMPNISAEGNVSLQGLSLNWSDSGPAGAKGNLGYTGGYVSWASGQGANLPPLQGVLHQRDGAAVAEIYSPEGTLLADGLLDRDNARLRVYRAWPALLGFSQGGSASDVVFETSQQLLQ